jgi:hypothetical protein
MDAVERVSFPRGLYEMISCGSTTPSRFGLLRPSRTRFNNILSA